MSKEYKIFMDGDSWCATGDGFTNIQESLAGFAKTPDAALNELIKLEIKKEIRRRESIRHWVCNCCKTEFDYCCEENHAPCPCCKAGGQFAYEVQQ